MILITLAWVFFLEIIPSKIAGGELVEGSGEVCMGGLELHHSLSLFRNLRMVKYSDPCLTFQQAVALMSATDESGNDFRRSLTRTLADAPFDAFFFEVPPVSQTTSETSKWEFVLVDSPALASINEGDPTDFAEHLTSKRPHDVAGLQIATKLHNTPMPG